MKENNLEGGKGLRRKHQINKKNIFGDAGWKRPRKVVEKTSCLDKEPSVKTVSYFNGANTKG